MHEEEIKPRRATEATEKGMGLHACLGRVRFGLCTPHACRRRLDHGEPRRPWVFRAYLRGDGSASPGEPGQSARSGDEEEFSRKDAGGKGGRSEIFRLTTRTAACHCSGCCFVLKRCNGAAEVTSPCRRCVTDHECGRPRCDPAQAGDNRLRGWRPHGPGHDVGRVSRLHA